MENIINEGKKSKVNYCEDKKNYIYWSNRKY